MPKFFPSPYSLKLITVNSILTVLYLTLSKICEGEHTLSFLIEVKETYVCNIMYFTFLLNLNESSLHSSPVDQSHSFYIAEWISLLNEP